MRLDHFLIPEGLVSEPQGSSCIVGCSLTKSAHGSDHRAIYVDFDTGSEETNIPIEEWTAPRKEDGQAHRPRYSRARRCWSRKAQTEEMHKALDACPAEIAATSNPAEIFAILRAVERQTAEEGDSAELAAYKALRDTEVHFKRQTRTPDLANLSKADGRSLPIAEVHVRAADGRPDSERAVGPKAGPLSRIPLQGPVVHRLRRRGVG